MRGGRFIAIVLVAGGCWRDDLAEIPPDVLRFQPEVEAPMGWLLLPIELELSCPDGTRDRTYLLYPAGASPDEPMPAAILFHSGAWDFVFAPDPQAPLEGTHFADPSRLSSEWANRQLFVTLGMYPEQAPSEVHTGQLPAALIEAGLAVMLPANCWGDLWASRRGVAQNDFSADFFYREGRSAAEWSHRMLIDPAFAATLGVELPIAVDPDQVYGIGLGEGSRALMELLAIDNDGDGIGDHSLAGAIVDSPFDDLRVYLSDPVLYQAQVQGLQRIFPSGSAATTSGSLWGAGLLPERLVYVYSSLDTVLPNSINTAALEVLSDHRAALVIDTEEEAHVLLNADDAELTLSAVEHMLGSR